MHATLYHARSCVRLQWATLLNHHVNVNSSSVLSHSCVASIASSPSRQMHCLHAPIQHVALRISSASFVPHSITCSRRQYHQIVTADSSSVDALLNMDATQENNEVESAKPKSKSKHPISRRAKKKFISIPRYIRLSHLTELINKPLREVTKQLYSTTQCKWFIGSQTAKQRRKTNYGHCKSIVLNYEQAEELAKLCGKTTILIEYRGSDLQQAPLAQLPLVALDGTPLQQLSRREQMQLQAAQKEFGPAGRPVVRLPVITLMGAQTCGKTSLLDALRNQRGATTDQEHYGMSQCVYVHALNIESPSQQELNEDGVKSEMNDTKDVNSESTPPETSVVEDETEQSDNEEEDSIFNIRPDRKEKHTAFSSDSQQVSQQEKSVEFTFFDTPGHELFESARLASASNADLIVLLVDATKGVEDQTVECLRMIKDLDRPVLVVLTKMDALLRREYADSGHAQLAEIREHFQEMRIQLVDDVSQHDPESITMPCVALSARTGQGMARLRRALMQMISAPRHIVDVRLSSEAQQQTWALGSIVDTWTHDPKLGSALRILVRRGILRPRDNFVCDLYRGKVKRIYAMDGSSLEFAVPGQVVDVAGLDRAAAGDALPQIGTDFIVCSAQASVDMSEYRQAQTEFCTAHNLEMDELEYAQAQRLDRGGVDEESEQEALESGDESASAGNEHTIEARSQDEDSDSDSDSMVEVSPEHQAALQLIEDRRERIAEVDNRPTWLLAAQRVMLLEMIQDQDMDPVDAKRLKRRERKERHQQAASIVPPSPWQEEAMREIREAKQAAAAAAAEQARIEADPNYVADAEVLSLHTHNSNDQSESSVAGSASEHSMQELSPPASAALTRAAQILDPPGNLEVKLFADSTTTLSMLSDAIYELNREADEMNATLIEQLSQGSDLAEINARQVAQIEIDSVSPGIVTQTDLINAKDSQQLILCLNLKQPVEMRLRWQAEQWKAPFIGQYTHFEFLLNELRRRTNRDSQIKTDLTPSPALIQQFAAEQAQWEAATRKTKGFLRFKLQHIAPPADPKKKKKSKQLAPGSDKGKEASEAAPKTKSNKARRKHGARA